MVLEIKVPHGGGWKDLTELIPTFLSYILSFVYIGIYWGNHHHLLHSLKQVSSSIIWGNINLLFWLSLVPFVTGWMGENHFATDTVALYGFIMLVSGFSFFLLMIAVQKNSHDNAELKQAFNHLNRKGIVSTICYASSIPLAYIHISASFVLFIFVSILWLIPDKKLEDALKRKNSE